MKVGDLVKTVYRKDYAIVVRVWYALIAREYAARFIYSDGTIGSQPSSKISDVISANR
tara:strand:+ start:183 stop:356 length:174 start_codon:yes stop_codon:yes gene_type:complete